MILGFKLCRRLLAAVALDQEQFTLADSRYVANRKSLPAMAAAYFRRLIEQTKPSVIYCYAPTTPDSPLSVTHELLRLLEAEGAQVGVSVKPLTRSDIFGSFGLIPLRTRQELTRTIADIWPALKDAKVMRQAALAEAAATALVGEMRERWPLT